MSAKRWVPGFHIAPEHGWINDPNGLVRFGGRYHVFYQHYPDAPHWGPMHWGHVSSADLVRWQREPIALYPDQPYEAGCFSGSAVDDGGVLTLIYTAHNDGAPIPETQCIARSFDGGRTFVKPDANPVIPQFPEDASRDFRDPKVFRAGDEWRMVVGTSFEGRGRALLYASRDLEHWDYRGVLCESDGTMGSMWECPNFCEIDGQPLLIVSPMNMPGHKNMAIYGVWTETERLFPRAVQELDFGPDFYAAQVLYDENRTLLFGWMDHWGSEEPTQQDGWCGALTLPRVLSVRGGHLSQVPAPELKALRTEKLLDTADAAALASVRGGLLEMQIKPETLPFSFEIAGEMRVTLQKTEAVVECPNAESVHIPLSGKLRPRLWVFIDRSSVELFLNNGEACYSKRIFPNAPLSFSADGALTRAEVWALGEIFD